MQFRDNISYSIYSVLDEDDELEFKKALELLFPFEIVELINHSDEKTQLRIFSSLSSEKAIQTFKFVPFRIQSFLMRSMSLKQAVLLLTSLQPDNRTQFLQELPRPIIDEYAKVLSPEERGLTLALLGYPEKSIGRLMTPDYIAVKMDWTIEEVLDHIIDYGHDSETINVIYVIDDNGKLLDDIKIKDFLFVPRSYKVEQISDYRFVALSVNDSDVSAINVFKKYDRTALPVIDEEGTLLGIVTIDDVLRLASKKNTKDFQKIGGMAALDDSYMETPFFSLIKKRAGWLVLLFLGEMFTATALGYFEDEISKAVVLALFLPLIISSGGNSGSQASTLIVRALALGEVKLKDWWRIMRREFASGLLLGIILGVVGFLRISVWSLFTNIYGEHWPLIALTIFFALIGVVMWGSLMGSMLPIILKACRVDPATSSAPLVATLVDVTGLVIYFLIAIFILTGTLL